MPLTKKGRKIKRAMQRQYGKVKGTKVFYATVNKGVIKGSGHRPGGRRKKRR